MTARSAQSRKWLAGALRTGRAAAFLVLATGINGTIAALEPRYEPIYVYLLSVVIVAWLGSALLGVTTAVAAVICYDWMFAPVRTVPSLATVVPLTIAVAAALATRLAKTQIKPRVEIAPTPPPQLLTVAQAEVIQPPVEVVQPPVSDRAEVAELQRRLNESIAASRLRHATLQQELDVARAETAQHAKKTEAVHSQLDAAMRRVTDYEERIAALQQELDLAWRKADEEKGRADREAALAGGLTSQQTANLAEAQRKLAEAENSRRILQQQLESAKRVAQEENARAERESTLRAQLENAARATLHRTADVSSSHQRAAAEAQQRVAAVESELTQTKAALAALMANHSALDLRAAGATERAAALESELAAARASLEELNAVRSTLEVRAARFEEELDRVRGILEEETARADRETELREVQEITAARKHDASLVGVREQIVSLQEEIVALTAAVTEEKASRTRAEEELAALSAEVAASKGAQTQTEKEAQVHRERTASLQQEIVALTAAIAAEKAARSRIEDENNRNLERIVAGITTDYEHSLGEALLEKEAARAELRSLTPRIDREKKRADEERAARETLEAEYRERIAALNAHADELSAQLERERENASRVSAEREAAESEWNANLTRIVTGITSDYENSIGEATVEREAARAEVRNLTAKVADLRKALEAEKAAKDALDTEWSEKLQKIVAHLASDHEADIGEAMMAKEAARAEVRTLTTRIATLQQKIRDLTPLSDHPAVVLVVHSDPGVRASSKQALEQSGYSVVTAADGLEGLRYAAANRPDVVLAEAVMPKMNGRELVQLLKSRPETSSMKIVLMNGNYAGEGSSDFRADDIITDPADFTAMRETLANVLGRG